MAQRTIIDEAGCQTRMSNQDASARAAAKRQKATNLLYSREGDSTMKSDWVGPRLPGVVIVIWFLMSHH